MGAGKIIFLHGDCVQCGKGCMDFLNKEIQAASAILALCGKETEISLSSSLEKDSSVREKKRSKLLENRGPNLSRRQFFGYLKTKTKVSVGSTLHYLAENEENKKKTVLTADVSGTENEYYVNALIALGGFELIDKMLSERLLPSVSLDMERCKLCAVCSKVCPNGVFTAVTDMVKGRRKVTAIRMDSLSCTGCGICALSCPSKVIKVVKS
jgi:NAD-dependent dihydropyrimidine dehydrogenase PreA subunit